ncbi:MAG: DUF58 domain-containing protein [Bacillota bacterium]
MEEIKDFSLVIIAIIGITSIFTGYYLLFFSSFVVIFLILLAQFWNENIFNKLNIKRDLSKKRGNIGDKIYYEIEIENKKLLPVLGLILKDKVTVGIDFINDSFSQKVPGNNFDLFQDFFSLKWYEKVNRKYDLIPQKRGYYRFGEGNIFYSGIFGFYKNKLFDNNYCELIVYPKVLNANELRVDLKQLFGSSISEGWVHKDPLNKVGVRPYESTDDIKKINWKSSARHNKLESNVYKPSYDKEVHLFLSTLTTENWWEGINSNLLELLIIYAASIANYSLNKGFQIGLYSDGLVKRSASSLKLKPGKGSLHKKTLFSNLAMLQPADRMKFSNILYKEKKNIKNSSTVIVILAIINDDIIKVLNQYRKKYNLSLIIIGDSNLHLKDMKGIKIYKVSREEDWDEIKELGLA